LLVIEKKPALTPVEILLQIAGTPIVARCARRSEVPAPLEAADRKE
jgi:hypothetical protein